MFLTIIFCTSMKWENCISTLFHFPSWKPFCAGCLGLTWVRLSKYNTFSIVFSGNCINVIGLKLRKLVRSNFPGLLINIALHSSHLSGKKPKQYEALQIATNLLIAPGPIICSKNGLTLSKFKKLAKYILSLTYLF